MTLDIDGLMESLSKERPIFHFEADFQLALARHILKTMPGCRFRLEHPFSYGGKRNGHLDIWIPNKKVAIELKYYPRKLKQCWNGEPFALKNQDALDVPRHGFLMDMQRLEYVVRDEDQPARAGFAVLLTNDPSIWECSENRTDNDSNFYLYEGRNIRGKLLWQKNKRPDEEREPVCLEGCYKMRWKNYSKPTEKKNGEFRYLVVPVQ